MTEPEFNDFAPAWDPAGKYLYFLSYREFNPVYDALHFDLGFPTAMRPLLVTLQKTLGNPFVPEPHPLEEEKEDKDKEGEEEKKDDEDKASDEKSEEKDKPEPITIDLDGISQRVVAFPYPRGRYGQIAGIEGKVIFTSFPGEDAVPSDDSENRPRGTLHVYDFKEQKKDTLVSGIEGFRLSGDGKTLVYVTRNRLRVIKAGKKWKAKNLKAEAVQIDKPVGLISIVSELPLCRQPSGTRCIARRGDFSAIFFGQRICPA